MAVVISGENDLKKVSAGRKDSWNFTVSSDSPEVKLSFSVISGPDAETAPDWDVTVNDSTGELWSNSRSKAEIDVDIAGKNAKEFKVVAECPRGARYADTVTITITAEGDGSSDSITFEAVAKQSIMILKTQIDQEKSVADSIDALYKSDKAEKDVYAILSPGGLRGYVFVEGMDTDRLREKTRGIRKARNFIEGEKETDIEEIAPYLTPVSAVKGIVEGDIVELVNGPFKGEKARVQQIDQGKEEITVELIEAMVPIPVTVKGDSVRVLEKEK